MKDNTKEILGFIAGLFISIIVSWFSSLFVFQRFILKGQQSSMGFEYIPVLFGTPILAFFIFVGLFALPIKLNLASRLSLCIIIPILACIGGIIIFHKM